MEFAAAKVLAAGMATFALAGVGLGLGKIFSSVTEAVGRNPGAKNDLFPLAILGGAMTESIALFAFVVAMMILFQ